MLRFLIEEKLQIDEPKKLEVERKKGVAVVPDGCPSEEKGQKRVAIFGRNVIKKPPQQSLQS